MKRSEYRAAIKDKLFDLLSNMASVNELVLGVEEINNELGLLPPEIKVGFKTTNGKHKVAFVNKWEIEQENL